MTVILCVKSSTENGVLVRTQTLKTQPSKARIGSITRILITQCVCGVLFISVFLYFTYFCTKHHLKFFFLNDDFAINFKV